MPDTPPDGQVDDVTELTSAFLTASRLLVAVAARSLTAAEERVTLRQYRMLVLMAGRGETNLVTLAESLAVNPSTALRMVDRLVDVGFVARRVNPASRREVLLQLTQSGKALVDKVTARRRVEIGALIGKMSARDRAGLIHALRAFAAAGGEYPAEDVDRDLVSIGWA